MGASQTQDNYYVSYKIGWIKNGVLVEFVGETSIEDIDEANQKLYEDERLYSCLFVVFNFDSADLSKVTLEQVRITVESDRNISLEFPDPILVITSNHPITDALIFYYQLTAESFDVKWDIKRFGSVKDALRWCYELA
ncbi:hypothetical protein A3715_08480 [Oleiphilus sp. HI0009]|nr:hypothetical protein A3715_24865 [Oleiphilus sp. HI0009]KZX79401.1 hypothetical protein A3715_08480 [Oleiphilus sp. HI0009]